MKASIYNPYFDTLGGGEKYTIFFANVLAKNGYDVRVQSYDKDLLIKLSNRFGIKLSKNIEIVDDVQNGKDSDLCFWVSDGSIPTLGSRRNFIHFQVPFKNVNGRSLFNKMKLIRVEKVICNSEFTKHVIDQEYGVDSAVLYPPISVEQFKSKRKLNNILYVGRFSNLKQSKKQQVLVDAFSRFVSNTNRNANWKLILAGGTEVGSEEILPHLKENAKGQNIEIVESPNFSDLKQLYATSKIFWSAAGYGEDENINPDRFEHFGMTQVEAMASGCVPIVYEGGGHKEVVVNNKNGFLWKSIEELIETTQRLIDDKKTWKRLSNDALKESKKYSDKSFELKVLELTK